MLSICKSPHPNLLLRGEGTQARAATPPLPKGEGRVRAHSAQIFWWLWHLCIESRLSRWFVVKLLYE